MSDSQWNPLKFYLIKYKLDIHVFKFKNFWFLLWFLYKKDLRILLELY